MSTASHSPDPNKPDAGKNTSPAAPKALWWWLRAGAQYTPETPALVSPEGELSYAALLGRVVTQANALRDAGFKAGDRIGIAATRQASTIIHILATLEAGLAYVPLDLSYPADRLQSMLSQAQVRAVLGDDTDIQTLVQAVGPVPTLQDPAPASQPLYGAQTDLAYVLFTSGSTGQPKGVAMGAQPLRHLIDWHATHPRLGQACRTLLFAPLSFDVHFQEIASTLACLGTLILIPESHRRDPGLLRQAIITHQVDRLFLPYVALQMLAEADRDADAGPRMRLRDVISAGEQLQITPAIRALFDTLPQACLHNHYGPTESHVVTAHELIGTPDRWPDIPPIGQALPHVRVQLRDVDTGGPSQEGLPGELLLGGTCLAHGYLGQAGLSQERFVQRPGQAEGQTETWYATGDLVQLDVQGVLTYMGRADQQLKVDGFRIEPGEIELALMTQADIQEAVVTAPELPGAGRQLLAHLVWRGTPIEAEQTARITQIRQALRATLPEYMVPVRFISVSKLPLTPSGKIDRKNLPLPSNVAPASTSAQATLQQDALTAIRTTWQSLLGLSDLDEQANVFDLGAKSLMVLRFVSQLKQAGYVATVAQVYDKPTAAGLAAALNTSPAATSNTRRDSASRSQAHQTTPQGIAIVGMAVRTAGAKTLEAFWQGLLDGREGIQHFKPEELDPSVPETLRLRPNFVAARGVLEDADRFDAAFFGISTREATVLDPQQRLFLELCWSALEHAAIDPTRCNDRVGVYAGSANNSYTPALRQEAPELVTQFGEFGTMLGAEKDYIATRVANRLNLKGPAISIHTACSTSLVAITQAWHALNSGQCDVALAGGMTLAVPQHTGYLHVEGGMESADGHCRPFDAQASGTVFASGGGAVVLKRLSDALADGDTVYAVIKGVGINNDGGDKASFTAPSVSGQADAIRMALDEAGVSARSIGYVEAHGTGTALGDPIEVAALAQAWASDTQDTQFCTLGSVKGHLGHLVAGAGVIGLIKSTLALHLERIPGTLHFESPNPQIDFAQTPFVVTAQVQPWPRQVGAPRRAAVSSFGVGGTNAHAVLEEAPARALPSGKQADTGTPWVLPVSAKDPQALQRRLNDLAEALTRQPNLPLADVAATLMRGRAEMPYRQAVVAQTAEQAASAWRQLAAGPVLAADKRASRPRLVYLFPGQGSQHPGMAKGLYDTLPAFRHALDEALAVLQNLVDAPWLAWLVHAAPSDEAVAAQLSETRHAQPALFCVSYALSAWLDSLGLQADARIGHSIGEWAAACHAGVFDMPDALRAVVARGAAMQAQPRGAMLAVRTGVDALQAILPASIEVAGINAPGLTVLAGQAADLDTFQPTLDKHQIAYTRLKVSHAFHSASMDGALPVFKNALTALPARAPQGKVYSSLTGQPLSAEQATSPDYWAQQIRGAVCFSQAVQQELAQGPVLFVEVGSGQALSALVRQHRVNGAAPRIVSLLGPAQEPGDATQQALQGLGQMWAHGAPIDWPVPASARRAALPVYPFLGERHWFTRRTTQQPVAMQSPASIHIAQPPEPIQETVTMSRLPALEQELKRILCDVSGLAPEELQADATLMDQGLDSLSMTQATLELERVFGIKLRFRRLMEDLDTLAKLVAFMDAELPKDKFAPQAATAPVAAMPVAATVPTLSLPAMPSLAANAGVPPNLVAWQIQLIEQQLQLLKAMVPGAGPVLMPPVAAPASSPVSGASAPAPAAAPAAEPEIVAPSSKALVEKPFGASARITLKPQEDMSTAQRQWVDDFITRYNARTGQSKVFSQRYRAVMSDPRVVTGFNPLWKDLVYPIVVDKSKGNRLWDIDGNEYIDLLSAFGANLLGYQPDDIAQAMIDQVHAGLEVGPQHALAGEVAELMAEFTGMDRVAFCNTGSEAVMGALRMARTVTGRKTVVIFTNSYHGIFDEVIVRGTKQLRSLSAAPGILASAVENILVLDYGSDAALDIIRERGHEFAAVMIEPVQSRNPHLQPREFVQALRPLCDEAGCALIFDEVITGFRAAPGGAQEFYGVRADIATYGKVIGGGLPFAAIAGRTKWMDALDGGHWQYGDDSYPEAGVTYFAGTFVRHPLALAAARASLRHLKKSGPDLFKRLNARTTGLVERLNDAFAVRSAPVKAVHFASLWRLSWDEDQRFVSLFYYLLRFHGLHLYEQFGHFMTEAFTDADVDRIFHSFVSCLDELMALGLIRPRLDGGPGPQGGQGYSSGKPGATSQGPSVSGVSTPSNGPVASSPMHGLQRAPLTPGQTERWLAARFDTAARQALNESFCLELLGQVDSTQLQQAVVDVVQRHEAFRISFDADEPIQILHPHCDLTVGLEDLSARYPDMMVDPALAQFCDQASRTDFVLEHAPLAKLTVLKLGAQRHVVHLVANHLVFDGWASTVFVDELAHALSARQQGHTLHLPPADSPLVFGVQEEARMASSEAQADLRYWQHALQQAPQPAALADRTPPSPRAYAADTIRARIEAPLLSALKATAKTQRASLFQTLLSALALSLRQLTGQQDLVISIPYAGQSLERHGPLIGDGVLDLPVRLRPTDDLTGAGFVQQVRNSLMDATDHPLVTQGTLARALGLPSRGDRPPLTGVFFNLNPKLDLSGFANLPQPLQASLNEAPKRGTLNELFFNLYDAGDHLTLDLHHSTELFSPQKAQALVDGLLTACAWLSQHADQPLPTIGNDTPATSASIDPRLLSWNATEQPLPPHSRVEDWISRQAARTPQAPAVTAQDQTLSYAQLEALSNQIAHVLQQRGAGPGQFVGLCLDRGVMLLPALLGVLKTGAAYVPLDPGFPTARLHYMAQDADLRLLVTESAHAELIGLPRTQQLRVDDDLSVIQQAPATPPHHSQALDSRAPAYAIYTSGSTGQPKGVVVPQDAVCNFLMSMRREPGLHAGDHLLAVTTLSFDIAVLELLLPLTVGARTVLVSRDDAADGQQLRQLAEREHITVMQATPTTWMILLDAGWQAPLGFKGLCGGEPLPAKLAQDLIQAGVELWNMYGPTETTVWSTTSRITQTRSKISVGRPIANTTVWMLDETGQVCSVGTPGELCIGGLGVALGYHQRPDLTADKFMPDPFSHTPGARLYRTGDLAMWREDGQIEHLGRLDHQVKIRGYRIELGEIENRLGALPGVARCIVVAREEHGQAQLVAYVVPQAGHQLDTSALRDQLRQDLPDYMVPQHHVQLDAMPLLPNGKIDRKALPAPTHQTAAVSAGEAPQGELEQTVAHAMAALLGLPQVGRHDHFFELGGHSLLAARLSSQLMQQTGQRLGLKAIFDAPTPAQLAVRLQVTQQSAHSQGPASQAPQSGLVHRADQSHAPLSLMQQRLWFLDNLQPGGVGDNLPSAHRLRGPLNIPALEQALQDLVNRQAVLRTRVQRTEQGAQQEVLSSVQVSLHKLIDLSGLPPTQRDQAAFEAMDKLVQIPFDLETGPLFAVQLFKLSDQEHVLFFMTHHIIWDGWSFDLMYQELAQTYPAFCAGLRSPLPPVAISYGDFATWQHNWMQGDELQRQLAPWVQHLTPLPAPLDLPIDKPRPAVLTGEGATVQVNLPKPVLDGLHAVARRHRTTVYNVVLSIYTLLMARLSRQTDFVIGTPMRGRDWPELESVMGFFVNMLPLRMSLNLNQRFDELLTSVQQEVTTAFANPDVPFESLVRALNLPRDLSRPALYQVLFSFQDVRERPTTWGALQHSRFDLAIHGSAQELGLWCVETNEVLEAVFVYNTNVFSGAMAQGILDQFVELTRAVLATPAQPLYSYPLLNQRAHQQLLSWNATERPFDKQQSIPQLLAPSFAAHAQSIAVQDGSQAWTYQQLNEISNGIAQQLAAAGVKPGDLVGLSCSRDVSMLAGLLGILKAGAGYVPLDPAFPAQRLQDMSEDAHLRLIVCNQDTHTTWSQRGLQLIRADQAPAQAHWTPPDLDASTACAYVIFTSGSTGRPKGVIVQHSAVCNLLHSLAQEPGLQAQDRLLAVTTLSFDIAVLELFLPLLQGARIVIATTEQVLDPQALQGLIRAHNITVLQATPSVWRALVDAGWNGQTALKALVGGEPLPPTLAHALLTRTSQLWNMYGPTETTVWSTTTRVSSPDDITIGRPMANTTVWVVDEHGQCCAPGVIGEICIGGEGVTLGYLQRPDLTADKFIPDTLSPGRPHGQLYRTGDRGRWTHHGQLEHLGRLDHQVKVRGFRIELGEIEAQLARHPAVAHTVVVTREDRPGDVRLVAYVVSKNGPLSSEALREHLRDSLPAYMIPQHIVQLEAIPLLPNGKTNRHALPAPLVEASTQAANDQAGADAFDTDTQRHLAEVWRQLLDIHQVRLDDNFFDLGGHSLLSMQAITQMEKRTGKRVNPRRYIFESFVQLATSYDETDAVSAQAAPSHQGGGLVKRLFGRARKP